MGRNLTQRFPEGRDEVGRLGSSFNAMLERLSASFERERRFTDDASHELRTPLAVITAACDFALEQGDEAEYREALTTIAQKAGQMNAMVEQMLQMARMEGGRVSLRREQLDFSALCVSVAEETVRGSNWTQAGGTGSASLGGRAAAHAVGDAAHGQRPALCPHLRDPAPGAAGKHRHPAGLRRWARHCPGAAGAGV